MIIWELSTYLFRKWRGGVEKEFEFWGDVEVKIFI